VGTSKDLYALLGLPKGAPQEDIRSAHRRLVREYHPDANPGDDSAEERFKEVQHAYEVLSDPRKRREYDEGLRRASSRGGGDAGRAGGTRARAGRGAGTSGGGGDKSTSGENLSDLVRKLVDLSNNRAGGQGEGGFRLQGEDVARVAERLGVNMSRLSKLLGENIKVNAKVSFDNGRTDRAQTTHTNPSSAGSPTLDGNAREKRVKGPSAQRKRKSD
jgi:DnaJ-class molecular chaperone